MTTIAVIPVRMGSSRLPGKTLLEVGGKPLLGHLLDRLARCHRLDGMVVATSVNAENDAIAAYCAQRGTPCFRGAEDDVLGRLLSALTAQGAETGVLAFGDCPLIDPALVDRMVSIYGAGEWDFVGNDLKTSFPPGQEVEVFRVAALVDSATRCADPAIREHSTLFIRQNPALYRLLNVEAEGAELRPELEMEVDTAEDMAVMEAILSHFGGRDDFAMAEIIAFLDSHPNLKALNAAVPRRWKMYRHD